ncbi:hypothetical protein ACFL6C_12460 [Myxococcota bacterium]
MWGWIDQIGQTLAFLQQPRIVSIELGVNHQLDNPNSNHGGAIQLLLDDARGVIDLDRAKTIFRHEYGHSLFFTNIGKYSNAVRAAVKCSGAIHQFRETIAARMPLHKIHTTAPERLNGEQRRLYQRLTQRVQELAAQVSEFTRADFAMREYIELFADFVAVWMADDPKAMAAVTGNEKRDFSLTWNASGWKDQEFHNALSPTRSHLWKRYCEWGRQDPRRFFDTLLHAVGTRVDAEHASEAEAELPVAKVNQKLMAQFDISAKRPES